MRAMLASPPRLVLDTNVALDVFVFGDPVGGAIRAALAAGEVALVVDEACREEWIAVLGYPALGLSAERREAALQDFDAHVQCLQALMLPPGRKLPRCADPDDQKFLELALASGACWLLSKDKAVLQLARRIAREGWFQILPPAAWQRPSLVTGFTPP